ncbi:MAG: poly-gamma-glutamate synthase PgsB [Planctomycetales bacterium]|nr:poly-gamma-glutamate synthase PgsB [Planctomycetales bacterium]
MDRQRIVDAFVGRLGFLTAFRKRPNRAAVPIRIYVAKGHGSSSITRLITAGLRAGGLRACGKTSTTSPRLLFPDGREYPVYRPSNANLREQRRVTRVAEQERADVLVLEGIATKNDGQRSAGLQAELQTLNATHVVLANGLPQQTDARDKVVSRLAAVVADRGKLFAAVTGVDETEFLAVIDDEQIADVRWVEMERFSYIEYREHVAIALRVCEELGVDRETALSGMWRANPDPGVATVFQASSPSASTDCGVTFVNGFAVSDPARLRRSWEIAAGRFRNRPRLAIVNCRADRPECWRRLADSLAKWTPADHYLIIGTAATLFAQRLQSLGIDRDRISCTRVESADRIGVLARRLGGEAALVLGIGSMSGATWGLVNYFRKREARTLQNAA